MKKLTVLLAVSALLGMVACSTDEGVSVEPQKPAVSFTASFDGESRIAIEGKKINWVEGDSIGIVHVGSFIKDDDYTYIESSLYTTQEGGSTASFVKDEYAVTPEGTAFYGVYPYWGLDWCSGNFEQGSFDMELRTDQKVNPDGGFCYPHPFMLAYTENNELNFKNLCTVFKIEIGSTGIREILLEGENLAGQCTVGGVKSGEFAYLPDPESHGSGEIRIAGQFMMGTTIYAFGWPTTTKLRMSVNGEVVKELDTEKEFKRNTIYNLGEVKVPNRIYVYNFIEESGSRDWADQMNIWSWNNFTPAINYTGGAWPGVAMNVPNREEGEELYSYEMPEEARNEVIQLLFNNGSAQTGDSMPFTLNRDFYFRVFVDSESGQPSLSFAHDWDYGYENGCREIYVPVESVPAEWEHLYIYAWDPANGDALLTESWPGDRMDEADWQIYRFTDGKEYYCFNNFNEMSMHSRIMIIFNDGQGGGGHQTADLRIRMDQNRCFVLSNDLDTNGNRAWSEVLAPCYQWEQVWW